MASRRFAASPRQDLLAETAEQALFWLVAANTVGLLLALLLLLPGLGDLLAPFSYGRLMPLHLNLELYGWCALPLIALLFRWLVPVESKTGLPRVALFGWSVMLGAGAASWLAGSTSGKIFLDWRGGARWLLLAELVLLEVALAKAWWRDERRGAESWVRGGVLALLALVPVALFVATDPATYPPINPATGGPTGGSLLGSTLGILILFVASPFVLGLTPKAGRRPLTGWSVAFLAVHTLALLMLDRGDHSHRELSQNLAILSLLPWVPWLGAYLSTFEWPISSRRWLTAFGGWAALLVGTSALSFQPGVLDRLKFTHGLVAHAHLAMAGMLSSFLLLALTVLGEDHSTAEALAAPRTFWAWQLGSAAHLVALATLALAESQDLTLMSRGGDLVTGLFLLRAGAGAMMLLASFAWWRGVRARRLAGASTAESFDFRQGEGHPTGGLREAA